MPKLHHLVHLLQSLDFLEVINNLLEVVAVVHTQFKLSAEDVVVAVDKDTVDIHVHLS